METEIPTWVLRGVGIAAWIQVITGLFLVVILFIVALLLLKSQKQILGILENVHKMSEDGTKISNDAANTSHNVTGAVNRVSNLVGTAATKLESPVIRAVGLASGLIAASKSVRGKNKTVVVEKRKKGLFG